MIEKWKDTAFGSDFGGDFLELVESITDKDLSVDLIYRNTDLKKYIYVEVGLVAEKHVPSSLYLPRCHCSHITYSFLLKWLTYVDGGYYNVGAIIIGRKKYSVGNSSNDF